MARNTYRTLFNLCVGSALVIESHNNFLGLCMTTGVSMVPTIDDNGGVLILKSKNHVQAHLKKGDVVLCRSVQNPEELLIKRVLALECDLMPESKEPINRFMRHANYNRVARGHIWVAGDNKRESNDSRYYGPIPLALVEGRVLFQLWPKLRWIESTL